MCPPSGNPTPSFLALVSLPPFFLTLLGPDFYPLLVAVPIEGVPRGVSLHYPATFQKSFESPLSLSRRNDTWTKLDPARRHGRGVEPWGALNLTLGNAHSSIIRMKDDKSNLSPFPLSGALRSPKCSFGTLTLDSSSFPFCLSTWLVPVVRGMLRRDKRRCPTSEIFRCARARTYLPTERNGGCRLTRQGDLTGDE